MSCRSPLTGTTRCQLLPLVLAAVMSALPRPTVADQPFRAGAAVVDVSPIQFPVAINGGMTARQSSAVEMPVAARAIVMAKGDTQVAMVVVDSCMLPRHLLDEAKALAHQRTDIPPQRMMISATHTHSAPAAMSCLGTDADPDYQSLLRVKLAEAIEQAQANLVPARVGFGSIDAAHYAAIRRWIRRPDRIADDPFGNPTVRATMHAGRNPDDAIGPSGPEDPQLSLLALQTLDGQPIAVMANFSMHYFSGVRAIHPDYFGLFSEGLQQRLAEHQGPHPVVGLMSHGCSGDIWRRDYTGQTPERFDSITIDQYSDELVELAIEAYEQIEYDESPTLAMAEQRLPLNYRVPNVQTLHWAEGIVQQMGDRLPETTEEVYAREQLYLHQWQSTDVVVQAIRIGSLGIATTPCETYALTGLKLKLQSPLEQTMVIELAGGGDGYIPPPEQHVLGGYNTWPARSAGLEVEAEPKIVETALSLLEQLAEAPRRCWRQSTGPAARDLLAADPLAYWRLDELAGPRARDASGNNRDGIYEPGVVFFLDGPAAEQFTEGEPNRAAHFAGGRLRARIESPPQDYSVSLWFWNGMPTDGRQVTGWIYSRGNAYGRPRGAEQLGVGGTAGHAGRLILQVGSEAPLAGQTEIERWSWYQVRLERRGGKLRVYLNDAAEPEIQADAPADVPHWADEWFFGGSSDGSFGWEGRLDEIAIHQLP